MDSGSVPWDRTPPHPAPGEFVPVRVAGFSIKRRNLKNYRKELWFHISRRLAFVNITPQVETCLRESGIREGLILCNAMHISPSSSTMTRAVSTMIMNDDWSGSHRTSRSRSTSTNGPGKTTGTLTSSDR
jgi:hypothetical protein